MPMVDTVLEQPTLKVIYKKIANRNLESVAMENCMVALSGE